MKRRGLFAYAAAAKLTSSEEAAWRIYSRQGEHACRTPEDWADLYATICHFKRRLMQRNGGPTLAAATRRQRILQHL